MNIIFAIDFLLHIVEYNLMRVFHGGLLCTSTLQSGQVPVETKISWKVAWFVNMNGRLLRKKRQIGKDSFRFYFQKGKCVNTIITLIILVSLGWFFNLLNELSMSLTGLGTNCSWCYVATCYSFIKIARVTKLHLKSTSVLNLQLMFLGVRLQ